MRLRIDDIMTTARLQLIVGMSSIPWGLRLPAVLLQSKRLMRPVIYRTKVDNATERIITHGLRISAAIDAHICAEPPSCNGVCCIVEQASRAAQEQWSLTCVTWTMLYSLSFLSTALINEPEAFASTVLLMFSVGACFSLLPVSLCRKRLYKKPRPCAQADAASA